MTEVPRIATDRPLAPYTWFRVGGPAERLALPRDIAELRAALSSEDGKVTPVGVGSNLLVRDGGVAGLVVRLGRGFNAISVEGARVRAGAGALDMKVAQAAAEAGIGGLEFLRGVPGSIGGAVRMNAGCYGTEICDRLIEATVVFRDGRRRTLSCDALGFSYRHCALPDDAIVVEAVFEGIPEAPQAVQTRMAELMERREAAQPIRERTGGSTFRNPPGESAWRLIDAAGCRGLRIGDAQVSEKHCNFLINHGNATAAELERLGETVRERVRSQSGYVLSWEIRRIGRGDDTQL